MVERETIRILKRASQTKFYERDFSRIQDGDIDRLRTKPYLYEAFEDIVREANKRGRESLFHTHPNGRKTYARENRDRRMRI